MPALVKYPPADPVQDRVTLKIYQGHVKTNKAREETGYSAILTQECGTTPRMDSLNCLHSNFGSKHLSKLTHEKDSILKTVTMKDNKILSGN